MGPFAHWQTVRGGTHTFWYVVNQPELVYGTWAQYPGCV